MHNPPVTQPRATHTRARWLAVAALAASALVIGCGDATDDRPAKWSFIAATILQPTCATASCHSEMVQRAGVDLHERNVGYASLVGRHFVIEGDTNCVAPAGTAACPPPPTCASAVIHLMCGQGSIRMPPDFPLPHADIALIAEWIAGGATNE
jgi:hypothetical protein